MATTFPNLPGVKINEVLLGAPPIVGVGTSTAAFVGKAPNPKHHTANVPIKVTSPDQFMNDFVLGRPKPDGTPDPADPDAKRSTALSRAVLGFFTNGGAVCYVVDVLDDADKNKMLAGVATLARLDDVNMLAAPGSTDKDVCAAMIDQSALLADRVALLDPPKQSDVGDDMTKLTKGGASRPKDSMWAAFYYPRITVGSALGNGDAASDPPSEAVSPIGHIAGVYAQVDNSRGVHKAPANVSLAGVQGVEYTLTDAEQNVLNDDGVDALRLFDGNVVVWGARTLQASGVNILFRYISTRRFANYVEQSLKRGLRFAVFEPNNLALRQVITRSVKGFLDGVFFDGALFGASPEEAYYVRFPEPFNRDEDRLAGRLVVEIGLRPAPPAEFIIIRIGLLTQSAAAA
jgi:uncharacterized protein